MNSQEIEKFINTLPAKEKAMVTVLHNAANATLKKYNTSHATSDLKDWQGAEVGLAELIEKLSVKDEPGPSPAEERRFRNILEVVQYLKGQGWKVQKTKAYADKKAGSIMAQPDGSFLMSDVDRYIVKAELKKADGADPTTDRQERKSEAETTKIEKQAAYWEHKMLVESGKYVPREQMEHELAARAAYLRTDFENFGRSRAAEMVAIVDGDPAKTPELLDFFLKSSSDWLDRYAKQKEFTAPA